METNLGELLRQVMRHWPTGVAVVATQAGGLRHGMTVNSFASVSLEPPVVTVTLANPTRTCALLKQSGILGITVLSEDQGAISDRFAGRIPEEGDRFAGLETFSLSTGAPLLQGGLAYLDCRVRASHPLEHSTLFLLDVVAALPTALSQPLVYFNRQYHKLP
jgi:flavin reductase (DIM6/NTAB) family NADH-FMN oxidoreductase RutF